MDDGIDFLFSRDILGIGKDTWEANKGKIEKHEKVFSEVFTTKVLNEKAVEKLDDTEYPIIHDGLSQYLHTSSNALINAVGEGDESKMAELDRRVREITILLQEIKHIRKIQEPKQYLPPTYGPKKIQDLIRKFSILLLSSEKRLDSGVSHDNEGKVLEILERVTNKDEAFKETVKGADKDSQALFEIGLDGMEPFRRAYLYVYLGNYLERIKEKINKSALTADKKEELLKDLDINNGENRGIALQIDELFDRLLRLKREYDLNIRKLTSSLEDLSQYIEEGSSVVITDIQKEGDTITFTFIYPAPTKWRPSV